MYWKDFLKDRTCVIIGNGPSLADVPDSFLEKYPTFGANNLYVRKARTGFQPTFYVNVGRNHLNNKEKRDVLMDIVKDSKAAFLGRRFARYFPFPNVYPLWSRYDEILRTGNWTDAKLVFSYEPLNSVGVYGTVTYCSLQLAHWMGVKTALLVGCENTHGYPECHFYGDDDAPLHRVEDRSEEDIKKMLGRSAEAYSLANKVFADSGRRIINLTPLTRISSIEVQHISLW